jgi:hypothetical protein
MDFRVYFVSEIGRPALISRSTVTPAGETSDLASHQEIAPQNIKFDGGRKGYRIGKQFLPVFEHTRNALRGSATR